jgi:hypothetical protein
MKKYLLLIIMLFSILFGVVHALEITVTWNHQDYPNEWYSFDTLKNANIQVSLVDKLSSEYISWNRVKIFQHYDLWNNWFDSYSNVWTWVLQSQLYGDFYLRDWVIKLINDTSVNSNCTDVSYSFVWTVYSPSFWILTIQPGSYYCPKSSKSQLILSSNLLWSIIINWTAPIETLTLQNSRWQNIIINKNSIFDDKKISVNWVNNIKNKSALSSAYSWENWWTIDYTKNVKLWFNKALDKNLVKYTKWFSPIKTNYSLTSLYHTKRIFYYDYESQSEFDFSNKENKWKILTLWGWATETDTVMWVYWQQLLYIKWWNLYINTDINNNSSTSQLVIVVKRDSTNRKNWGNVYINPNVTNIDATIIADWSIISYNWTNVLNSIDDTNWLRKQLLIYWSIATKNTFWEDNAIYWTDDYISNWWTEVNNIKTYNLANLRSFQVILNNDVNWDCSFPSGNIVAKWNTWTWAIQYAFAWKKECFIDEPTYAWLRSTEKVTSLVIEYNPIIQKNPHFILKK